MAGLSPHATYSVHPELLRRACELSAADRLPLAMHVAESREELEAAAVAGWAPRRIAQVARRLGAVTGPAARPTSARCIFSVRSPTAYRALVIHGNYLAADEIEFLAAHRERMSLVYCPRRARLFWPRTVPAGSDARRGRPRRCRDRLAGQQSRSQIVGGCGISPGTIRACRRTRSCEWGRWRGRRRWGWNAILVSISPGKHAKFAVVPLEPSEKEPLERLLHSSAGAAPVDLTPQINSG